MALEILNETSVGIEDLQPDPKNVNIHDRRNLDAIKESIKRFGQTERIIVRKSDNMIVSGNGRYEAAQELGLKKLRVQFVEGSDDEVRTLAVAANRTARLSRFNDEELTELLQEVRANDPGLMVAAGFNDSELDKMLKDLAKETPTEAPDTGLDVSKATPAVTCPACHHTFAVGGG